MKISNLFSTASLLSLTVLTIPDAEAANIPNGATITAPPQANQAMNFQAPAPGGTFVIEPGTTFVGALTTDGGAAIGTLVLNTGSQLNGAVGDPAILQVTLNGNATIIGATGAQNFSLGQNTLTNQGALNLPSGIAINTRVITNALFGNIAVTGADSIAGASVTVNVDASGVIALTPGQPLFVVSAQGTTSGLPVIVTSNNVLYSFIGNNSNGNITITPTLHPAIVPPGGVGSVFTALLTVAANNPGSDIATVMAAISALSTPAAIQAALAQLNPNVNGAIPRASFAGAQQFQNLWSQHMGYGRCIYAEDCCCVCEDPCQAERTDCDCYAEINCCNVPNRFEVWIDGFGYWGRQYARKGFKSYTDDIYGGMIGFQVPVCQEFSLGIGGGYAYTDIKESGRRNSGNIHTYDVTAYASYDATHFYLDGAFSFDYNKYEGTRHIDFPGIDRRAKSHYHGQEYTALAAAGYRWYSRCCFIFTPLASLQYSYLNVNKYKEHGAGDLNLHVKAQHYNFLESGLGLKVSRPIQTQCGAFVPEIHAIWLHDFFKDEMDLSSTFSGVAVEAGRFKVKGPGWGRDSGDVGASIAYIACNRLAIQLVYNYEFSSTYHANEALIKISYRF